jgi:hypothetical protein
MGSGTTSIGNGVPATSVRLSESPSGVTVDANGDIYLTTQYSVLRISGDGILSIVASSDLGGRGGFCLFNGDSGPARSVSVCGPEGVAVDAAGNVYIADSGNYRIRKVTVDGVMHTIAGNGQNSYSGDGGPAVSAALGPSGIALDAAGNLFIADTTNMRVRQITLDGVINTKAGNGTAGFSGDGSSALMPQLTTRYSVVGGGAQGLASSVFTFVSGGTTVTESGIATT